MQAKQIYIPSLKIKGTYLEEIGGEKEKITYPGKSIEVELTAEDFLSEEDYHSAWIIITRAVQKKLSNGVS
jgi:hypothetical protein